MKTIDVRLNMDNLSEDERQLFMTLVDKANNRVFPINAKVGETFKIADIEFIRFPDINGRVPIVAKDFVYTTQFDNNSNNFATSSLLKKLKKEILPKIEAAVGVDNVLEFTTDLISLDGLKDYGKFGSKISLPTVDFYKANVSIFDKYNPEKWWWLATPWSTPAHDYSSTVCGVDEDDALDYYHCSCDLGVRPILYLKSLIFKS